MKRHMVLWVGSGWEGCFTKQRETPRGFLGRFWVGRCSQKNLKRHMIFCERSGCEGCVIHPKKSETPHCLLGRFFVRRSPRKKT